MDKLKHRFSPKSSAALLRTPVGRRYHQPMLDNDEMARRVRYAFDNAGRGTQAAVARELGISAQAVTGWVKTGKIEKSNLPALARLTGRRVDYFLDSTVTDEESGADVAQAANDDDTVDILGYSQAAGLGDGMEAIEYAETHRLKFRASSLARKRLIPTRLAVFYGKGDSMLPRIQSGDAILFDTSDTRPADDKLFVIMAAGIAGSEYSVKRCRTFGDDIYFDALNEKGDHNWRKPRKMDDPRHPITIIGRVRWIGSWED
ncbi:LexA family transcriptional regulator [Stenotrophomonas maltophilia]|uniref:LexA family transcriptional regulator n=1 Tax=Stenotrophomonas maltophilia TaxID=40324 RepID=UPI001EF9A9DF|nr:S24 family peptidase [Stenotrophomonas maltophilia]